MNFHKNKTTLQKLLRSSWRKKKNKNAYTSVYNPGCYLISRLQHEPFQKLGMAWGQTGLYNRITSQYKICYPKESELWVKYFIITPRQSLKIPGHGKTMTFARKMELLLGEGIDSVATEQYSEEWLLNVNAVKLDVSIRRILHNNRQYWTHVVKFFPTGWIIKTNKHPDLHFRGTPSLDFSINEDVGRGNIKRVETPVLEPEVTRPIPNSVFLKQNDIVCERKHIVKPKSAPNSKSKMTADNTGFRKTSKISNLDAAKTLVKFSETV